MTTESTIISTSLPPLRRKIRRRFLGIIALYAIFGSILILGIFKESGFAPKLLHMNYDSIAAASEMKEAWFRAKNSAKNKAEQQWIKQFEKALKFQESNVTEAGENEATIKIRKIWDGFKKAGGATEDDSAQMRILLSKIISVNEEGMFRYVGQSAGIARRIFLFAISFFLVSIVTFLFWADNLALRLARPLKDIAETLRTKPAFGKKLNLPQADSLEMRILILELRGLWNHLGELSRLNLEELSAQRTKLTTVLSCIDDAILVLDNEERIIHCNPGMAKLLKLDVSSIRGNKWTDLPSVDETYMTLRETLKPGVSQDRVVEIKNATSSKFYSTRHRPIETEAGNITGTVYLLHDVTETRARDRLKAEFIGVLSHELKTPLQSLSTATEVMLNKKDSLDEDGKMLIDTIHEDVTRIRGVANDFMQLGLTDSPALKLKIQTVDLKSVLKGWVNPFSLVARDKKLKLNVETALEDPALVSIDPVKFPWVISNLLSNAIRVSPEEGTISIRLSKGNGFVTIEIADKGPGVPENVQRKMFEAFFQSDVPNSETGYLGLGLTIAREVVEAHNGTIEYASNTPTGAIFKVRLPEAHLVDGDAQS